MPESTAVLEYPALELQQGQRTLYSFAVDAKELPRFTTVSRIHRDDAATVQGYQRPEVLSHIASIRRYIESEDPMIPNALVIAFDERVHFEPDPSANGHPYARPGKILIPVTKDIDDADMPGWIVDGQQRAAAVREARIEGFPMFITAFITNDTSEQRSQFILVNSTKPLPQSLIYELLPTTDEQLPLRLERRKFPAFLLDRLNHDLDSPLHGMIRTPTAPDGVIKDNSILRMLENSLSDGALYPHRDPETGRGDIGAMLSVLKNYWTAVAEVFDDAWNLPPRYSRLMHGVGITSLGFVMDAISDRHPEEAVATFEQFTEGLLLIEPVCAWTRGYWNFGEGSVRKWNELQNLQRDINLVTSYLLQTYRRASTSSRT